MNYGKEVEALKFFYAEFYRKDLTKANEFKKSYDLALDLLQYQRENSAEYLYS